MGYSGRLRVSRLWISDLYAEYRFGIVEELSGHCENKRCWRERYFGGGKVGMYEERVVVGSEREGVRARKLATITRELPLLTFTFTVSRAKAEATKFLVNCGRLDMTQVFVLFQVWFTKT